MDIMVDSFFNLHYSDIKFLVRGIRVRSSIRNEICADTTAQKGLTLGLRIDFSCACAEPDDGKLLSIR